MDPEKRAIAQQNQVRLGFAVIPQANRPMNANYRLPNKRRQQQHRSSVYTRGMTDRRSDSSPESRLHELDAIFLPDDHDLNHAVVVFNTEGSSKGFDLHGSATQHIPRFVGLTTLNVAHPRRYPRR